MTIEAVRTQPDVRLEVLANRLQAICNEMGENILRAAYSTFIKETWDIAAMLNTPEGETFACSKVIASKRLGMNLAPSLAQLRDVRPGDIFMSNDPISTGGMATHLPDVYLWKPIFADDQLVCFALAFVHVSDIGGAAPGSVLASATELAHEGLRIPPLRLFREGEVVQDVKRLVLTNSRVPDQVWGDIAAVIGALNTVERRVTDVITDTGAEAFVSGRDALIDLAERRARAILRQIPDGSYEFIDYVDSLPNMGPIRVCLTLHVRQGDITMDFEGSDPEVDAAYNLHSHSQDGHWGLSRVFADYVMTVDRDVPWNSGLIRPIRISAPEGSVLNPTPSAACAARVATFFRIYYVALGALSRALTELPLPASGPAHPGIMLIATNDPLTGAQRINVGQALYGGGGATPNSDGFDGQEMVSAYNQNVSVEMLELEMPVRFLEYGFAASSGGGGRFRGGHGVCASLLALQPNTVVSLRGIQRHQFRAWGVHGGKAGKRGVITLNPGMSRERHLETLTVHTLHQGEVLRVRTPGGGGYGDPLERPAERVAQEVSEGLVSAEDAFEIYGVVMPGGELDSEATRSERESRRIASVEGEIDFGDERTAFDAIWTADVHAALRRVAATSGIKEAKRIRHLVTAAAESLRSDGRLAPQALLDEIRELNLTSG